MAYPVSLDELTDGVPSDGTAAATSLGDATYQHDDHHRALAVAVEAVEAELGTAPSGASATVADRFGTLTNDVFTGAVSFGGGISLTGTASVADRKITMQAEPVIYLPKEADFSQCIYLGSSGGGSLAAGASAVTAVGRLALSGVTTGSNLVGLGYAAGYENTTGVANVFVGGNAGRGITTGSGNTILGAGITGLAAGAANLTLVGSGAGANASGTVLTGVGASALYGCTAEANVAVGTSALYGSTGAYSSALGWGAGVSNTGTAATLVGYAAGQSNTGANLTAVGYTAGFGNTAANVTALGSAAGASNAYADVVLLGKSAVAAAANQFVVGSASSQQTYWVPGHDPDTYISWATADKFRVFCGGNELLTLGTTKPAVTGSRGGNAALASLLTTLAAMNLITDSTS